MRWGSALVIRVWWLLKVFSIACSCLVVCVCVCVCMCVCVCVCVKVSLLHHSHSPGGPGMYTVVQCGSAGHNLRSIPSMRGTPVGRLTKGSTVSVVQEVSN